MHQLPTPKPRPVLGKVYSEAELKAAFERIKEPSFRSCARSDFGSVHGDARERPAHHVLAIQEAKDPSLESAEQRKKREDRDRRIERGDPDPSFYVTSHAATYVKHGPDAKPARLQRPDPAVERIERMARANADRNGRVLTVEDAVLKALDNEEKLRQGHNAHRQLGFTLIAQLERPKPTNNSDYGGKTAFGGSNYWKSEHRDKLSTQAFSASLQAKYKQPAALVDLARHDRFPGGFGFGSVWPNEGA